MYKVAIVGNGHVGFHLYQKFLQSEAIQVTQVNSRESNHLQEFDIAIIAVSDDAISEVSKSIQSPLVVHTSGTTHIDTLQNSTRKGVFYPLQSFSKDKEIDFSQIPFCLETEHQQDLHQLENLVSILGAKPFHINSEQRKRIHVAAVFANNFTNHLYAIAKDICDDHDIPFAILFPLIQETATKIRSLSPRDAQTGPAMRRDLETIKNHVTLLNDSQRELYEQLTASIQSNGKKL